MYDVVILGSGPAGLSAAVYAKRAVLDTVVVDKSPISGGQINTTYEVDNYLGLPGIDGYELAMKFKDHADKYNTEMITAEVRRVIDRGDSKVVELSDGTELETRTVIIATGAKHRKLGVPGEEQLTGAGVSYCATCDGAFFRDKTVAVVGGGDVAIEDAIFLARGCKQVYVIHRRDELRGAKILQDALMALPNVTMVWDTVVRLIDGNDRVESLEIEQVKTGETKLLDVDGIFIAVGIEPESEPFLDLGITDESGYIAADETGVTRVPGIFAAGDVRTKQLRQIVNSVSDGANCAVSAEKYLTELSPA